MSDGHEPPHGIAVASVEAMLELGAKWAMQLAPGDVAMLEGPLGVGKSTLVRGVLRGLGYSGVVRSPTFNLLQTFETQPPVLHVDLYRVDSYSGLGIEDYLDSHVCLIEWADRAAGLLPESAVWRVTLSFAGRGRRVLMVPPAGGR